MVNKMRWEMKSTICTKVQGKKRCEWNSIIKNHMTTYHWNHLYTGHTLLFLDYVFEVILFQFTISCKREMIYLYNKLRKSQQLSTFIAKTTISYNRMFTLGESWPNWKPYVKNSHLVRFSIFQKILTLLKPIPLVWIKTRQKWKWFP